MFEDDLCVKQIFSLERGANLMTAKNNNNNNKNANKLQKITIEEESN